VITRIAPSLPEHVSQDPVELAPDITELEMVTTNKHDGHLHNTRWIVEDVQVKPQHGKPSIVTVWSACCGRPRHRLSHGYAFSCPACGWWWRYHYVTATASTRLVSLGRTKP